MKNTTLDSLLKTLKGILGNERGNVAIPAPAPETEEPETPETPEEPITEVPETPETTEQPETPENPESPEQPDPVEARFKEMDDRYQAKIAELEEKLKARAEAQPQPQQPGSDKPSPEVIASLKQMLGFAKVKGEDGSESITLNDEQFANGLLDFGRQIFAQAKAYADSQIHGNVSDLRFETAISELETKNPGIRRLQKEIKDHMKKRYKPQDIANPEFILETWWMLRGKNPQAQSPQVPKKGVRAIPPAPAGKSGRPAPAVNILPGHRQMVKEGFFKDEKEAAAWDKADLNKL